FDRVGRRLDLVGRACRNGDRRSRCGEGERDLTPDPPAAAGDDGDLAGEVETVSRLDCRPAVIELLDHAGTAWSASQRRKHRKQSDLPAGPTSRLRRAPQRGQVRTWTRKLFMIGSSGWCLWAPGPAIERRLRTAAIAAPGPFPGATSAAVP